MDNYAAFHLYSDVGIQRRKFQLERPGSSQPPSWFNNGCSLCEQCRGSCDIPFITTYDFVIGILTTRLWRHSHLRLLTSEVNGTWRYRRPFVDTPWSLTSSTKAHPATCFVLRGTLAVHQVHLRSYRGCKTKTPCPQPICLHGHPSRTRPQTVHTCSAPLPLQMSPRLSDWQAPVWGLEIGLQPAGGCVAPLRLCRLPQS